MSRIIRIDSDVEQLILLSQRRGETKQETLSRLVREGIKRQANIQKAEK